MRVSDDYTIDKVILSGADYVAINTVGQLITGGILKNGRPVDISINDATFEIIQANPAGAASLLAGGAVEGRIPGTATIRAIVTYQGFQYTRIYG